MKKPATDYKPLTKAEEAVMQALWLHNNAFIKEIIAVMSAPMPHYNTVSTLLKILAEKGFVASKMLGNAHQYYALVSKEDYSRRSVQQIVKGYFNNSLKDMVSFFAGDKSLDIAELEDILKTLKNTKK